MIGGTPTRPLQEQWPRRHPAERGKFKTVLAVRKDDEGKWWQAAWRGDEFMWGTPRNTAELEAAQETAEAKAAALTAVVAVKKVEPTCPVRGAPGAWQTRTGLDNKRVSALLRCDGGTLCRWQNGLLSEAPDARISLLVQGLLQRSLCDAEVEEAIKAAAVANAPKVAKAAKAAEAAVARKEEVACKAEKAARKAKADEERKATAQAYLQSSAEEQSRLLSSASAHAPPARLNEARAVQHAAMQASTSNAPGATAAAGNEARMAYLATGDAGIAAQAV